MTNAITQIPVRVAVGDLAPHINKAMNAMSGGDDARRLFALPVWRETPFFTGPRWN